MSSSSIQCERILTANLPTGSVPGEKFMFDAETPDSTEVGMSITNSKGKLLRVVDKSTTQKLANMQQQINVLKTVSEIPLPYNEGYNAENTLGYPSKITKESNKKGTIYFSAVKTNGETFKVGEQCIIASLPVGFLSKFNVSSACCSASTLLCINTCALFGNQVFVFAKTESISISGFIEYEVIE